MQKIRNFRNIYIYIYIYELFNEKIFCKNEECQFKTLNNSQLAIKKTGKELAK